jgi:MSHA biogenesis protein MshK
MKALHHPYLAALLLTLSAKAAADRLIDPTRPPQAPSRSSDPSYEGVRVEAVLRSAERDLAIVNGKIVRAGDRVAGVQIEAILPDGVRYVRDGQVRVARLQPASIPVRQ